MAHHWLLKTEPSVYSFWDLLRDESTVWDGVTNPLALRYLGAMSEGDLVAIYHTGAEKSVVGTADCVFPPAPDPQLKDPKRIVVRVRALRALGRSVPLAAIKSEPDFADSLLVRLPRLSVLPLTGRQWTRMVEMAGGLA